MKELTDLLAECLDKYNNYPLCDGNTCQCEFFCTANECSQGYCMSCMNHIQRSPAPKFHYKCEKITYHYVLRFFNRFASEIAYIINSIKPNYFKDKTKLNVVSLGCGPGSEVYGFIQALRAKAPHVILDYQGFDLTSIWGDVQEISKKVLSQTPHSIDFFDENMFGAFGGFKDGPVDMLVLNYLLSDSQKFYHSDIEKIKFINEIVQFVIENNIRNILFNDNCYYGRSGLDSGVRMMLRLIHELKRSVNVSSVFRYFPTDGYTPSTTWKSYSSDKLCFPKLPSNTFDINVTCCRSKQILVHINS